MSLLDEYRDKLENPPEDLAKKILFDVIDDITGRRDCDFLGVIEDDEIEDEILSTNLEIIRKHLSTISTKED